MALNRHGLTLTSGWLALVWLHRYDLLAPFGLGHGYYLPFQWIARLHDTCKARLLGSTGWMILLPDFLLDGPAPGLLQSRCVIDRVAEFTAIGVTLPARLSIMILNAGLDRDGLADVNYLVTR